LRRDCRDGGDGFICAKREVPPFGGTSLSNSTDAKRELASLTRVLLARVLLAWVLLLLAGLLLPAALLLAGLLTGVLVLLARILILIAHSEFSFASYAARTNPDARKWLRGNSSSGG
jgi:hypothetical protein